MGRNSFRRKAISFFLIMSLGFPSSVWSQQGPPSSGDGHLEAASKSYRTLPGVPNRPSVNPLNQPSSVHGKETLGLNAHPAAPSTCTPSKLGAVGSFLGHQVQTIVLIMIITGFSLVEQHLVLANLEKSKVDKELLKKQAGMAAEYILQSGEIWSSIAGALAAGAVSYKALNKVHCMIHSTAMRGPLKMLLQSGISVLVTFLGWEIGAQLFRDAVSLIPDPSDHERAQLLVPLIGQYFLNRIDPNEKREDDARILKIIFGNMGRILMNENRLRNHLLFSAWRHHIGTGGFAAIVGGMTVSSVAANILLPSVAGQGRVVRFSKWLGRFTMMLFGLYGAMKIPEPIKHRGTLFVQNTRSLGWHTGLDGHGKGFRVRERIITMVGEFLKNGKSIPLGLEYRSVKNAFDDINTIFFEKIYYLEYEILKIKGKIELAQKSQNLPILEELQENLTPLQEDFSQVLSSLITFHQTEVIYLQEAIKASGIIEYGKVNSLEGLPIVIDIYKDLVSAQDTLSFMESFVKLAKDSSQRDPRYLQMLHRFYIWGFSQETLMLAKPRSLSK